MPHTTKLLIEIELLEYQTLHDVVGELPAYCRSTFKERTPGHWAGEFTVSCSVAPHLAEGDFRDDLAPYFPILLKAKNLNYAMYEMQIAVGTPAADKFNLAPDMVSMLAILQAEIHIVKNEEQVGLNQHSDL